MRTKRIQAFEHSALFVDEIYHDVIFEQHYYVALSKLNILHDGKYFETRHNSIKFKQFVGVIQVDDLTIEILPKIDNDDRDENVWQKALIEMLRVTRKLKVQETGSAYVTKQNIHLLDIYFEWFLNELESLIRLGLIKQYYKQNGNVKSLKGKIEFGRHLSKNLVHKERFYTAHQVYDKDHLIHQILNKALQIIERCTKGTYLYSTCKRVQLDFPDVTDLSVTEATFSKISKSRKTAPYASALAISRFIILNFAPNISRGTENMLALLFDMNLLWEQYILAHLEKEEHITVYGQQSTAFWNGIEIRPDIVIESENDVFVIDTKWKNLSSKASTHDLRQMYVYNDYWKSFRSMLLYPANSDEDSGFIAFEKNEFKTVQHQCALAKVSIFEPGKSTLDSSLGSKILRMFSP